MPGGQRPHHLRVSLGAYFRDVLCRRGLIQNYTINFSVGRNFSDSLGDTQQRHSLQLNMPEDKKLLLHPHDITVQMPAITRGEGGLNMAITARLRALGFYSGGHTGQEGRNEGYALLCHPGLDIFSRSARGQPPDLYQRHMNREPYICEYAADVLPRLPSLSPERTHPFLTVAAGLAPPQYQVDYWRRSMSMDAVQLNTWGEFWDGAPSRPGLNLPAAGPLLWQTGGSVSDYFAAYRDQAQQNPPPRRGGRRGGGS